MNWIASERVVFVRSSWRYAVLKIYLENNEYKSKWRGTEHKTGQIFMNFNFLHQQILFFSLLIWFLWIQKWNIRFNELVVGVGCFSTAVHLRAGKSTVYFIFYKFRSLWVFTGFSNFRSWFMIIFHDLGSVIYGKWGEVAFKKRKSFVEMLLPWP